MLVGPVACKSNDPGSNTPDVVIPPVDENPDEPDTPVVPPKPKKKQYLEACVKDDECESTLCVDDLTGDYYCSKRCEEVADCGTQRPLRCSPYSGTGNDVVRACLPTPNTYCIACDDNGVPNDSKCGGYGNKCVDLGADGWACGRDCSAPGSTCPDGSSCQTFGIDENAMYQCVPDDMVCSGCVDTDGDGYGVGGDACRYQGFDCNDNNSMVHPGAIEICDDVDHDCDGDTTNGFDLVSSAENCGGCNIHCDRPNMTGVCAEATCGAGTCDPKFYDNDGDYTNGCEYYCVHEDLNAVDLPDSAGMDTNCDGIDGDASLAVYVSTKGDDLNAGTRSAPVRSITRGLEVAGLEGKSQVLVTGGDFTIPTAQGGQLRLVDGISIFGGYDSATWTRNIQSGRTQIKGTQSPVVVAQDLTQPTELAGVTIQGVNYAIGSQTSIAMLVSNVQTDVLTLRDVAIYAGNGGAGENGAAGVAGAAGPGGGAASSGNGAGGGSRMCGTQNVSGGSGGTGRNCAGGGSLPGIRGNGAGNGDGGGGGWDYCPGCALAWHNPKVGGAGSIGGGGTPGGNGAAASAATLAAGMWSGLTFQTAQGGNGANGANGSGGGGGGAGGAAKNQNAGCGDGRAGGGGGGGGAGGCSGSGGTAGKGGGGSFGLVLNNAHPALMNTQISRGNAGRGGSGGNGGSGGGGGGGGIGYTRDNSTFQGTSGEGGRGGNGGSGGSGSGGAGACGGPSVGIALVGGATVSGDGNLLITGGQGGAAGTGGTGGGSSPAGPNGCTGLHAETHTY